MIARRVTAVLSHLLTLVNNDAPKEELRGYIRTAIIDAGGNPDKILGTRPEPCSIEKFQEVVTKTYASSDAGMFDDVVPAVQNINCLRLTATIDDDLDVEFDSENSFIKPISDRPNNPLNNILGYHIHKGMTFCGVLAGGDWEVPLVYIVWWDGTELRGYVPREGNPFNKEHMSAYGNCDSDPDPNTEEGYNVCRYDVAAMLKDIETKFNL